MCEKHKWANRKCHHWYGNYIKILSGNSRTKKNNNNNNILPEFFLFIRTSRLDMIGGKKIRELKDVLIEIIQAAMQRERKCEKRYSIWNL